MNPTSSFSALLCLHALPHSASMMLAFAREIDGRSYQSSFCDFTICGSFCIGGKRVASSESIRRCRMEVCDYNSRTDADHEFLAIPLVDDHIHVAHEQSEPLLEHVLHDAPQPQHLLGLGPERLDRRWLQLAPADGVHRIGCSCSSSIELHIHSRTDHRSDNCETQVRIEGKEAIVLNLRHMIAARGDRNEVCTLVATLPLFGSCKFQNYLCSCVGDAWLSWMTGRFAVCAGYCSALLTSSYGVFNCGRKDENVATVAIGSVRSVDLDVAGTVVGDHGLIDEEAHCF